MRSPRRAVTSSAAAPATYTSARSDSNTAGPAVPAQSWDASIHSESSAIAASMTRPPRGTATSRRSTSATTDAHNSPAALHPQDGAK